MSSINRIPPPIKRYLQNLELVDNDLFSEISKIFSSDHDLVTHFGVIEEGDRDFLLFSKEQLAEKKIAMRVDFLTATGFGNYVAERTEQSKTLVNIDGVETEFNSEYSLVGKTSGIVKTLLSNHNPDLEELPVFLAHISGGRCWILGFSWDKDLSSMSEDELDYLQYASDLVAESLFEIKSSNAKFKVKVHSSIFDRVKNSNYSFPSDWITEKWGILKEPSFISFSPKVEKEISFYPGSSCVIFRDKEALLIIIREDEQERVIRLPFEELIDSGGKIRSSRVETSVKRNLALSRDEKSISASSLKTKIRSMKTGQTRIGIAFKIRSLGAEMSQGSRTWTYDEEAINYSRIIPQLLFLRFAKYSENLWNKKELRYSKEDKVSNNNRPKSGKKYSRILNWGTDKVRFISPRKGSKVSAHWVDSHPHVYRISREETIAEYQREGRKVFTEGGQTYGIRFIESYLKGTGKETNWDGTYNFGRRPRNYSQMAIRWLEWEMKKQGVTIQHAELGGEQRFSLNNGRSILVDGWCEETNTVYEFHGDAFHGNPEIYEAEQYSNPFRKDVSAGELYRKTMEREEHIISLGLNLVSIWESEWLEKERAR